MKKKESMSDLYSEKEAEIIPYKRDDIIEVEVLEKSKNSILVDVKGLNLGFIPEKEWGPEAKELKIGDKVLAYVLLPEDESGRVVLSLRRTDQRGLLKVLSQKFTNKETLRVKVKEANRGGLVCELGCLSGFLPLSQLSPSHYPRVLGDQEKIMSKLKELIGETLLVKIIGFDKKTEKPIFSEKALVSDLIKKIKPGEVLEGKVSSLAPFGIFVNLGKFEGLVHISEVAWEHISDLSKIVKIGEKIKVKVLGFENGRVFLSRKRLLPSPFLKLLSKYKIKEGKKIKGEVLKLTPFGAIVKLKKDLEGAIHSSLIPKRGFKVGKKYNFTIFKIDEINQRINLALEK